MFYKSSSRLFAAAGIAALAASTPATAAVVIDQEAIVATPPVLGRVVLTIGDRTPPAGSTSPALVNAMIGQSVTAGVTGILNAIEVQGPFWNPSFGPGHAFRLSLFSGDLASGAALVDSVDVPSFLFPASSALNSAATFTVDVSSLGFAVTRGSVFSFSAQLLGPPGANGLVTIGNVSGTRAAPIFEYNNYTGGSAYFSNNGSAFAAIPRDIGFRTYVDEVLAPAVPESSTWAMMLFGFGAMGMALRRRKQSILTA